MNHGREALFPNGDKAVREGGKRQVVYGGYHRRNMRRCNISNAQAVYRMKRGRRRRRRRRWQWFVCSQDESPMKRMTRSLSLFFSINEWTPHAPLLSPWDQADAIK